MVSTLYRRAKNAIQPNTRDLLVELIFMAGVLWVAHFWYFRSLGLYEDDYTHTSPALGWHLSNLIDWTLATLGGWPLGRPLGFILGPLLAFLGGRLGGLSGVYIIAYMVHVTNAGLFYFLVRRLGHGRVAMIGGLVFGLFPADTTHTFLMHALGLHTSLTFLLLGAHAYMSGHRFWGHALSAVCLLIYESPYMLFLAIPVLCRPWDKKLFREMVRHAAVWIGIVVVAVGIRAAMGEGRIAAVGGQPSGLVDIVQKILVSLAWGPAVALRSFWDGPLWTLSNANRQLALVGLGSLVAMLVMFYRMKTRFSARRSEGAKPDLRLFGREIKAPFIFSRVKTVKVLLSGLLMLSLAYGFSFTHYPPTPTAGRLTSVHLAAAFGAALLFAGATDIFLELSMAHGLGLAAIVLLAAYLSSVVAYRFAIQQRFKTAWQNEQLFWSSVLKEAPDMTEGTVILVWDHGLPRNRFIQSNSWADPLVLDQIFQFPSDWTSPPRLWVVQSGWTESLETDGDQVTWLVPAATWSAHRAVLPQGNTILMQYTNGRLVRNLRTFAVDGQQLDLKSPDPNASLDWKKGALYGLLIGGPN